MRILIISPYLCQGFGGVAPVVLAHAKYLGMAGVSVDIISTTASVVTRISGDSNWSEEQGFRCRKFTCWYRQDLVWSLGLLTWLWHHAGDYDVIHTHTLFSPLITTVHVILRLKRKQWINSPHGMLEAWALANRGWKKFLYFRYLEKPLLQHSILQALSDPESKVFISLGFYQTIVIPNGIPRPEFEVLPDPDIFYQSFPHTRDKTLILFLGRLDPKKGLDLLAPAFAQVIAHYSNVYLIIAGPDHIGFLPIAQRYFAASGCLKSVTFTGMLSGDIKRAALAAVDIYVAPSYSEGFSVSVLEAMASGIPSVITTGCNFPEALDAQVAKVVPTDANVIAQALQECLADMDKARDMGSRARQFIFENYTWDRVATKLIAVYQQILDKATIQ